VFAVPTWSLIFGGSHLLLEEVRKPGSGSSEPAAIKRGSFMSSIVTIRDNNGRVIKYRARYRTPGGNSRSRTFSRKEDATQFLSTVNVAQAQGAFIDSEAGKVLRRGRPTVDGESAASCRDGLECRVDLPRARTPAVGSTQDWDDPPE